METFNFLSVQISELQNEGRECILITSGAVAFGKQKLAQEVMMSMSMRETITANNTKADIKALMANALKKPNAAVGQSGLQALYETMFRNYGIIVGQVLVTKPDFYNDDTRQQLFTTINELLQLNIIPIINTNDAVSPPPQREEDPEGVLGIKDNDSLAARVAVETGADLAILMSDVDGIYDKWETKADSLLLWQSITSFLIKFSRPPSSEDARVMNEFNPAVSKTQENFYFPFMLSMSPFFASTGPAKDRVRREERVRHRRHGVQGEVRPLGDGERLLRRHLQRDEVQHHQEGHEGREGRELLHQVRRGVHAGGDPRQEW